MAKGSSDKRRLARREAAETAALASVGAPVPTELQRAVRRLTGARVCFGKPIEAHGHTVVPVATLRTSAGFGFGRGGADDNGAPEVPDERSAGFGSGAGGGAFVAARPVGFVDIGPDGVRYEPIVVHEPRRHVDTALAVLVAVAGVRLIARWRLAGPPVAHGLAATLRLRGRLR